MQRFSTPFIQVAAEVLVKHPKEKKRKSLNFLYLSQVEYIISIYAKVQIKPNDQFITIKGKKIVFDALFLTHYIHYLQYLSQMSSSIIILYSKPAVILSFQMLYIP